MTLAVSMMENIASMLLWVLVGFVVIRTGLVKEEAGKVLSSLTVFVFCPAMIFNAFQIELTADRIRGFFSCMAFAFAAYFIWIALSRLLRKPLHLHPVDEVSLVYGNVGNLVLPLVQMTLGDEMVFYASAIQIPFNLLFWTHGISVMQGRAGFEWRRLVKNFNLWAVLLGLLFLSFQWHLPALLDTTVTGLAHMVAPSSMMVVGMVLAGTSFRSIFTDRRAYRTVAGRLLVFPLFPLLLLWLSRVPQHFPELVPILLVPSICFAAPAATNVANLAVVFDEEPEHGSVINILSLFLCILTMPLYIALYQVLFG